MSYVDIGFKPNSIYFLKDHEVSNEEIEKFNETYYDTYTDLKKYLLQYMLVHGVNPSTNKEIYKYFSKMFDIDINRQYRTKWLARLARVIERNQHKSFDLYVEAYANNVFDLEDD